MTWIDAILHPRLTHTFKQVWASHKHPQPDEDAASLFVDHLERLDAGKRSEVYQAFATALPRATPNRASSRQRQTVRKALREAGYRSVPGLREAAVIVDKSDTLRNMVTVMVTVIATKADFLPRRQQLHQYIGNRLVDGGLRWAIELHVAQRLAPQDRQELMEAFADPVFDALLTGFRGLVTQALEQQNPLREQTTDDTSVNYEPVGERTRKLQEILDAAGVELNNAGVRALARSLVPTLPQLRELCTFYTSTSAQRARHLMAESVAQHAALLGQTTRRAMKHFAPPSEQRRPRKMADVASRAMIAVSRRA